MINTTLCYITDHGSVLMLFRNKKKNDLNEGKWVGVGGKFEEGESPEECLLREVKEECGLCLSSYRFRGIVTFVSNKWGTEYMHLFTADAFSGELGACSEGELRWIPEEELDGLPMWEGDRIFFDLIRQNEPFFSLKLVYEDEKLKEAFLNGKAVAI